MVQKAMEITSKFLTDLIAKLRSGVDVEDDKLDIKGQWYDLSDKKGQEEICKDIAAMANTTGPTGHIIIGINKDGSLVDSPFKESHLADKTHLQGIVVKRVDLPPQFELKEYEVEENNVRFTVSVISVPPSIDKPHVLGSYKERENYIPVRKNTGTLPAKRSDIERMYYDRKNIGIDFRVEVFPWSNKPEFRGKAVSQTEYFIYAKVGVVVVNSGLRSVAILGANLVLDYHEELANTPKEMACRKWKEIGTAKENEFPQPFILSSNESRAYEIEFRVFIGSNDLGASVYRSLETLSNFKFRVNLQSIDGRFFASDERVAITSQKT